MITLKNIKLNNSHNKTFILFEDSIEFKDNTIYFIIGKSGVGKTSLVDFLVSPFTDDPIKNGEIQLSQDIGLKTPFSKNKITELKINNSYNFWYKQYIKFVRKSIAFIPQKTDSFHPSIPVANQLFENYTMSLSDYKRKNKNNELDKLNKLLKELSKYAGWDEVQIENEKLFIKDIKNYIDVNTGKAYGIIKRDDKKIYEGSFSTGQLQRILILMGLLRFHASETPLLIADEFLVNFTYPEANDVLKNVIEYFLSSNRKKQKTAVFILHDLSFEFLKNLSGGIPVKLIAVEKDESYTPQKGHTGHIQKLLHYEMPLADFLCEKWENPLQKTVFSKYKKSYEKEALPKEICSFDVSESEEKIKHTLNADTSWKEKNIYKNIKLEIGKNKFIAITGFSGCGKTTLCKQYINSIPSSDKKTLRYFPSQALSFLSESSQVTIGKDLLYMYNYYNNIESLDKYKEDILKMTEKVQFGEFKSGNFKDFTSAKIYDLSGGELQRYWLSRILFDNSGLKNLEKLPELLILDESISSLDCITKNEIISFLLKNILCEKQMTILFVSHDLRDLCVIYKTILENAGQEKTNSIFEHYEMFYELQNEYNKETPVENLYKVKTPFPEYCANFIETKPNCFVSLNTCNELNLRLMNDEEYRKHNQLGEVYEM